MNQNNCMLGIKTRLLWAGHCVTDGGGGGWVAARRRSKGVGPAENTIRRHKSKKRVTHNFKTNYAKMKLLKLFLSKKRAG